MRTTGTQVIGETINKIADCVTKTMGAKGRLAVINDEFSRPLLTDDGVTVARQFMHLDDPFEKMIALSMCEAASNTERYAFDGTTLTILLIKELYNEGLHMIKKHKWDPQLTAECMQANVDNVRKYLRKRTIKLDAEKAEQLAIVTTKIPAIGSLVKQAYKLVGDSMNVLIEHDRKLSEHTVEFTSGMVMDHGFFTNEMQQLCNDETHTKTVFKDARLVLLSEGILSQRDVTNFFRSIPAECVKDPYVFFITKAFNPESLKILLDQLVSNHFTFQFVFVNEANPEELFVDLAARTNGHIQSAAEGTSEYLFDHCGFAHEITIEQDKTTILATADQARVDQRIAAYKKELEDNKYSTSITRHDTITRRLANLSSGVTKIKLACDTSTEYMTIKLKLDDAIGAVKCAAKEGLVYGGGKALWNLSHGPIEGQALHDVLRAPLITICENAGIKLNKMTIKVLDETDAMGIDVNTGGITDLRERGLYDSFSAIDRALANAVSIAASYIKAYVMINTVAPKQA